MDASLERLGLDYIDLLQCHRFDYDTPIEETMQVRSFSVPLVSFDASLLPLADLVLSRQALHDVVKSGKVRYIGMSRYEPTFISLSPRRALPKAQPAASFAAHVSFLSCFAYQFSIMQNYAINNKLNPFISMQNFVSSLLHLHSLFTR